jgi:hypothetical protein
VSRSQQGPNEDDDDPHVAARHTGTTQAGQANRRTAEATLSGQAANM